MALLAGVFRRFAATVVVVAAASSTQAQCEPQWTDQFAGSDIYGSVVRASTIWDDGSGPALYVLGYISNAGNVLAKGVAKWDGTQWSALGAGLTWSSSSSGWQTLAGVPLGGPAGGLYAKGGYNTAGGQPTTPISRWDGLAWSPVPGSQTSNNRALIGFDPDGAGPSPAVLYASNRVWDGVTWTDTGLSGVWTYAEFDDDGPGPNLPALYSCGPSLVYNGQSLGSVLRLAGGAWVPVGSISGALQAISWDSDGAGPLSASLCVLTNSADVLRFDGAAWSFVATSAGSQPHSLAAFDEDGAGPLPPTLFVGLERYLVKRVGGAWVTVATLTSSSCSCAAAYSLNVYDPPGLEPEGLYSTGYFTHANSAPMNAVLKWNGMALSVLSEDRGLDRQGYALARFDEDGPGPARERLFVGGTFGHAAGISAPAIAAWDGTGFSPVGGGLTGGVLIPYAKSLTVWDDDDAGPGLPKLIVGGRFVMAGGAGGVTANSIAAWDGSSWSALGSGFIGVQSPDIRSMAVFDDDGPGPNASSLIVAGSFTTAGKSPAPSRIATWDGAQWSGMGNEPVVGFFPKSLAVFDEDANGPNPPRLFVGGEGGGGIYKWDGHAWVLVGGGVARGAGQLVASLAVVDEDGPGSGSPTLWVAGEFGLAGGLPARNVARWDGLAWSAVGAGLGDFDDWAEFMSVVDTTGGLGAPTVFVGGRFWGTTPTGFVQTPLMRWNPGSQTWTPAAPYAPYLISAVETFDEDGAGPGGPALYLTGLFEEAGEMPAANFTRLACPVGCYANCDGSVGYPVLTGNDFQCFFDRFASGSPEANCDGSSVPPVLTANDFQCFVDKFASGCP